MGDKYTSTALILPDRRGRFIGLAGILGTWWTWFLWIGAVKCLAVLLPTLRDQMDTHTWVIGWMIVILEVSADVIGPFAPPLGKYFGIRICVMASGVVLTAALILASISDLVVMVIVLAVLAGPALGVSNVLGRELIGSYYQGTQGVTTAFSISQTGAAFAYMVIPALSQLFLNIYGWRGAILQIGGICSHLIACGALLGLPREDPTGTAYTPLASDGEGAVDQDEGTQQSKPRNRIWAAVLSALRSLNTDLLLDVSFWLIATQMVLTHFCNLAWLVYFIPHTQTKGFTAEDAATFTAIVGVTRIVVGVIIIPAINKFQLISTNTLLGVGLLIMSAYYFIDPWLTSYWLNVANVTMYGVGICIISLILDVILIDLVDIEQLGSAFGWIGMISSSLRFCLLYLPGLLYDRTGSYSAVFMSLGGVHLIAFLAFLAMVWQQSRK